MSKRVSELEQDFNNISQEIVNAKQDPALIETPSISTEPKIESVWHPGTHFADEWNPDNDGYWANEQTGTIYKYKGTRSENNSRPCIDARNRDLDQNIAKLDKAIRSIQNLKAKCETLTAECNESENNLNNDINLLDTYINKFNSAKGELQGAAEGYNSLKEQVSYAFEKSPNSLIGFSDGACSTISSANCDSLTSGKGKLEGYKNRVTSVKSKVETYKNELNQKEQEFARRKDEQARKKQ